MQLKTLDEIIDKTLEQVEKRESTPGFKGRSNIDSIAEIFFKEWFKEAGNAYFFLFKKNLKVTNIQFAELVSLLRKYSTAKQKNNLQILGVQEFNRSLREILRSFRHEYGTITNKYKKVFQSYSSLLNKVVLIDNFFSSCSVFLPPHIDIDLKEICFNAGYVHSCGRSIFTRNVDKAKPEQLNEALDLYLRRTPPQSGKKLFFAVYAHEDFTRYDRALETDLKDGLDDVKIFIEKYYMGNERLVSVLNDLKVKYKQTIQISDPGDYRKQHKDFRQLDNVVKEKTIWLIVDKSISNKQFNNPGDKKYYICYEQSYINQNPFHLFDENKPAWIAHTTIPHTLAGAMINIALSECHSEKKIKIHDPFGGSGTVWLEALKYENVEPYSSDKEKATKMLVKDNLEFFCLPIPKLKEIEERLSSVINDPGTALQTPKKIYKPTEIQEVYNWALHMLNVILSKDENTDSNDLNDSINLSDQIIKEMVEKDIFHRIFLYIHLRTVLRHNAEFERSVKNDWIPAFFNETQKMSFIIKSYIKLREEMENGMATISGAKSIFLGSYSNACSISQKKLDSAKDSSTSFLSNVNSSDAMVPIPRESFDIIITDPPYGFNTNENVDKLAELYIESLTVMIRSLKHEGQLVLCLPDRSYTGRTSPFFTHKEIVIHQVISIAEQEGFEIITPSQVSEPSSLFRPPFYWESERALRRSILHFKLRKLRTTP